MSTPYTIPGMMGRNPIHVNLQHDTNFDGSFRKELTRGILGDLPDVKIRISRDAEADDVLFESNLEELVFRRPILGTDQVALMLILTPDVVELPVGTSFLDIFYSYPTGGLVRTRLTLRRSSLSKKPTSDSSGGPSVIHRDVQVLLPGAEAVTIYWPAYLQEAGGRTAALRLLDPNGVPDNERVLKLLANTSQLFTIGFEPAIPAEEGWTLLWIG